MSDSLIEAYINATNKNIELSLKNNKLEIENEKLQIANEEMAFNSISIKQLRRYFMTFTGSNKVYVNDDTNEELYFLLTGEQ